MSSALQASAAQTSAFKHLEAIVTAFAQMAVVCTFGLAVAIGAAGLSRNKIPLLCHDCATPLAMAETLPRA